jgi:putative restriction endonuclease
MKDDELLRRKELWGELRALGSANVHPQFLRDRGIYGGAQGIWVDKKRTATLSPDRQGVTVSILHTGRHYPDDLSDDGLIYHYPETGRPPGQDAAEIQATKNAAELDLPIFVVLPGRNGASRRSVQLGWVSDFDDESKQFLILFGDEAPEYEAPTDPASPFELFGVRNVSKTTVNARPGQQRFRFQVLARYGCKCAVCGITNVTLVKAAHICGKAQSGCDDWRNGIPLCSTHHDAFDAHLFAVESSTLAVVTMPGVRSLSIGIETSTLATIHERPHRDALDWRFQRTMARWNIHKDPGPVAGEALRADAH